MKISSSRKNFATSTGRKHMVSALALQCSTNWATKTLQLGACQFVEFILSREKEWNIEDDVNCENTNLNEDMIVAVVIAILAMATRPEKISGLQRYLNPWHLRYRCSALPTELQRPNIGTCRGQFSKTFTSVLYKCSYWESQRQTLSRNMRISGLFFISSPPLPYRYCRFVTVMVFGLHLHPSFQYSSRLFNSLALWSFSSVTMHSRRIHNKADLSLNF